MKSCMLKFKNDEMSVEMNKQIHSCTNLCFEQFNNKFMYPSIPEQSNSVMNDFLNTCMNTLMKKIMYAVCHQFNSVFNYQLTKSLNQVSINVFIVEYSRVGLNKGMNTCMCQLMYELALSSVKS